MAYKSNVPGQASVRIRSGIYLKILFQVHKISSRSASYLILPLQELLLEMILRGTTVALSLLCSARRTSTRCHYSFQLLPSHSRELISFLEAPISPSHSRELISFCEAPILSLAFSELISFLEVLIQSLPSMRRFPSSRRSFHVHPKGC